MISQKLLSVLIVACMTTTHAWAETCVQEENCKLPECFCPTFDHPLGTNIPQIVYFGFDDAVQPQVSSYYDQLFTSNRKNPNGCPITMTLYVSDTYTEYDRVSAYYKKGMEIGVHSVTHVDIDTAAKLQDEGKQQKENIEKKAQIPAAQVSGWRSPNLKIAGDDQPRVLTDLGYLYDISLTYSRDVSVPWPYTLDFGYPYPCMIQPCPGPTTPHKGFWEVPVNSLKDANTGTNCGYVDGCQPESEADSEEYLWSNFLHAYETNRAPFGLNMHAAWFAVPAHLTAMEKFIDRLLALPDVYIVNVRQMLEWMQNPVPLSEASSFAPWGCSSRGNYHHQPARPQRPVQQTWTQRPAWTPKPTQAQRWTMRPAWTPRPQTHRPTPRPTHRPTRRPTAKVWWTPRPNTPRPTQKIWTDKSWWTPRPITSRPKPITSRPTQRPTARQSTVKIWTDKPWWTPKPTQTTTTHRPTAAPQKNPLWYQQPSKGPLTYPVNGNEFKNNSSDPTTQSPLASHLHQSIDRARCVQGVNCHVPSCLCRSLNAPSHLSSSNTPQIIYLAIDSKIDGNSFAQLSDLFSGKRKNANGCPISGTVFVPADGNYPPYVRVLKSSGAKVAVRGGTYRGRFTGMMLRSKVSQQIRNLRNHISTSAGWRGLANMAPNDDVFQTLIDDEMPYDSSIISGDSDMPWPYTLDYGLGDTCEVRQHTCPKGHYPGLWEIPVKSLVLPRTHSRASASPCTFPDTCPGTVNSKSFVKQLLHQNFQRHYTSNRAPFGINLHDSWFSNKLKVQSLQGLIEFIDEVLKQDDVVVLSIEHMLDFISSKNKDVKTLGC